MVFMKNAETLVAGIDYKVRKLIGQNGILQEENDKLSKEVNSLKSEKSLILFFQLFQFTPALLRTSSSMVRHSRFRLKKHQPTGAHHPQGEFIVLAVHVKAFIKPAYFRDYFSFHH